MAPDQIDFVIADNADVPHTKIVREDGTTLGDFIGTDNETVEVVMKLVFAYNHFEALTSAINEMLDANSKTLPLDPLVLAAHRNAMLAMDQVVNYIHGRGARVVA